MLAKVTSAALVGLDANLVDVEVDISGKSLKKAADPPLFTAATSLKVMKLCQEAVEKGNPNAISDAAVGALLADAALWGGMSNVLINLSALDDKKYVQRMKKELQATHAGGGEDKKADHGPS